MRSLEENKASVLGAWLRENLMPVTDPWHEGEKRRLDAPKMTAQFIIDLLEKVEHDQEARDFEAIGMDEEREG